MSLPNWGEFPCMNEPGRHCFARMIFMSPDAWEFQIGAWRLLLRLIANEKPKINQCSKNALASCQPVANSWTRQLGTPRQVRRPDALEDQFEGHRGLLLIFLSS